MRQNKGRKSPTLIGQSETRGPGRVNQILGVYQILLDPPRSHVGDMQRGIMKPHSVSRDRYESCDDSLLGISALLCVCVLTSTKHEERFSKMR